MNKDQQLKELQDQIDSLKKENFAAVDDKIAAKAEFAAKTNGGSNLNTAYELIATPVVCAAIGMGLDRLIDTKPLFFMVLAVLGVMAAFWRVYKTSKGIETPLDARQRKDRESP